MQYGANPDQYGGSGSNLLITTLTFEVISGGDGIADISAFINEGDVISTGVWGESSIELDGSQYSLGAASVYITPEPGTAMLLGLGLLGLARNRIGRGVEG